MLVLRLMSVIVVWAMTMAQAWAQEVPVPPLVGPVNDYAHVFDSDVAPLAQALEALHEELGVQLVVLTIPTLGNDAIAAFANRVMEKWHLGDKRQDTGLLLLAVPQDRQTRIEVGYGLEGVIPDAESKRIQATYLRPGPGLPLSQNHIVATVGALRATLIAADAQGLLPRNKGVKSAGDTPYAGMHPAGWLLVGLVLVGGIAYFMFARLPKDQTALMNEYFADNRVSGPRKADFLSLLLQILISLFTGRGGGGSSGGGYSGGGGKSGGGGSSDRY
jgi:uncharacterized protein